MTQAKVHHQLNVKLFPDLHRIEVTDTVTLEATASELTMDMDLNLAPALVPLGEGTARAPVAAPGLVVLKRETPAESWPLSYNGVIDYPLTQVGEEYARGQKETAGSIGPAGVYLDGGSGWYPRVPGEDRITFDLTVELPPGWDAVSQGTRTDHRVSDKGAVVRWVCDRPQEGIWLVAGKYHEYGETFGKVRAMAFFLKPEEELARKYLDATGEFVGMYEKLVGPYPYGKFALVENFWETGYGMPSFTLLGPRVIRFPFIIESSYPHEILHNWWGNSVAIDYGSGNWGEGLTAYLSDHLLKEQKGLGAQHRQESLQKYADYVLSERDLPLTAFRSRHGSVSEAVGYGKTMMLFHMLRGEIGNGLFREGLREFYSGNIFRTAGFDDVRAAFEKVSGRDLDWFFEQWVFRIGAPILKLGEIKVTSLLDGGYDLTLTLHQETGQGASDSALRASTDRGRRAQGAEEEDGPSIKPTQAKPSTPYRLTVPVAVTLEGANEAFLFQVPMSSDRVTTTVAMPGRPLRVDVDPRFDLFRRLDRREIPPALTRAFGARKAVIVLPEDAPPSLYGSYRSLAQFLSRTGPGNVEVVDDAALGDLPADTSVWLLGWQNRLLDKLLSSFEAHGAHIKRDTGVVELPGEVSIELTRSANTVVLAGRHPDNPDLAVLWIGADNAGAHEGLARKLPHYHKYSYLGFSGDAPDNTAKGRWPVNDSPMTAFLDSGAHVDMAGLPEEEPLVDRPVPFSSDRLMEDVGALASEEMKGRGIGTVELDEAARYVAGRFAKAGLEPGGAGGSWFQEWTAEGEGGPMPMKNVVGVLPGARQGWEGQSVVVGAHYDHLGLGLGEGGLSINRGRVHPGADDNASGVAVMMELARALASGPPPQRTTVFVAFTGEETGKIGSRHYLEDPGPFPAEKTMGMVNLDTVGHLGDGRLLVLGGDSAEEWVHIFRGAGYVTGVDVQVVEKSVESGDHIPFIEAGVPAVQLFTGPHDHYHKPTDTADRIDAGGLAKVAAVAREAITYLAGREEPLTSSARAQGAGRGAQDNRERKVSLGTVPDFSYEGEGVRLDGTVAGSPAEKAGLKKGDVVRAVSGRMVKELRDLSDILKGLKTGDEVDILVDRGGEPVLMKAVVEER